MFLKSLVRALGLEREAKTLLVRARRLGEGVVHAWHDADPASSILLAGSGRSGTTWLADLISGSVRGVQQIFEPIHPMISEEVRRLTGFDGRDPYVRSLYLRPHESQPEWEDLWRRVLTGRFRNHWTDYHEHWSYFPRLYLVKEIRANLMLGFLAARIKPRIVFLMRHPCGVVYSRVRKVRTIWQASTRDLLRQEKLVQDYLLPWVKDLEHETDLIGAHAAWWAVENHVAREHLAAHDAHVLTYEALSVNPAGELARLFAFLKLEDATTPERLIHERSRLSSEAGTMAGDVLERLGAWRHGLDRRSRFKILEWAHRFGLTLYTEDVLPGGSGT